MNESKIANRIVMAAAGPYTLLEQIKGDLNSGRLDNDEYLKRVGYGWGHTPGTDYIFGQAGSDIAYALIGFASGHRSKEEVLREIRTKLNTALRENEPFRGLRGEEKATHELWFKMMEHDRAASIKTAGGAIELVPTRGGMLETTPRYMMKFNGQPWGELYFNMRGYVAEHGIPVPSSSGAGVSHLDIGERSIATFKSEISRANREWAMRAASVKTAAVNEGDICTVDMRVISQESGRMDFGTGNWVKVVRDTVRMGGRQVRVESISGDNAEVVAEGRGFMGAVRVPVRALRKVASIKTAGMWYIRMESGNWGYQEADDKSEAAENAKKDWGKKEGKVVHVERVSGKNLGRKGGKVGMNSEAVARELVSIARELMATTGTFECPNCGTKVLENTGYCVKCEKKVKKAQWERLPKGWTKESLKSFYDSLAGGGDAKKKFYSCVEKIKGTDVTNPESFCGSLLDQFLDPSWRGVGR